METLHAVLGHDEKRKVWRPLALFFADDEDQGAAVDLLMGVTEVDWPRFDEVAVAPLTDKALAEIAEEKAFGPFSVQDILKAIYENECDGPAYEVVIDHEGKGHADGPLVKQYERDLWIICDAGRYSAKTSDEMDGTTVAWTIGRDL